MCRNAGSEKSIRANRERQFRQICKRLKLTPEEVYIRAASEADIFISRKQAIADCDRNWFAKLDTGHFSASLYIYPFVDKCIAEFNLPPIAPKRRKPDYKNRPGPHHMFVRYSHCRGREHRAF